MYLNGVYDELYVCYTHHVNSLSSAFRAEKMLPIVDLDIGTVEAKESKKIEFEVAPDIDSVFSNLASAVCPCRNLRGNLGCQDCRARKLNDGDEECY